MTQQQTIEIARLYMSVFRGVSRDFRVDRERVLAMLRTWMRLSQLAGSDVSWTVGDAILKTLKPRGANAEGGQGEVKMCKWRGGNARAKVVQERTKEAIEFVKRSESFGLEDDGVSPMCMCVCTSLPFSSSNPPRGLSSIRAAAAAAAKSEDEEVFVVTACNDAFHKDFTTRRAMTGAREGGAEGGSLPPSPPMPAEDDTLEYKTNFFFLLASLVRHADRLAFLRLLLEGLYTTEIRKRVELVKMYNAKGLVYLYIVSSKKVCVKDGGREEGGAGVYAQVLKFEVAPRSKHMKKNSGRKKEPGERGKRRARRGEMDEMAEDDEGEEAEELPSPTGFPSEAEILALGLSMPPLHADDCAGDEVKVKTEGGREGEGEESKCGSDSFAPHGLSFVSIPLPALEEDDLDDIAFYVQEGGHGIFAIPGRSLWHEEGGVPGHVPPHARLLRKSKNGTHVSSAVYREYKGRQVPKAMSNVGIETGSTEEVEWRQIKQEQWEQEPQQQQQQQQQQYGLQQKVEEQEGDERWYQQQQWQEQLQWHQQQQHMLGVSAFTPSSYRRMVGPKDPDFPFALPSISPPSSASHQSATPAPHSTFASRHISPCTSSLSSSACSDPSSSSSSCFPACGPSDHPAYADNDSLHPPHMSLLVLGATEGGWEEGVNDGEGRRNEKTQEKEGWESVLGWLAEDEPGPVPALDGKTMNEVFDEQAHGLVGGGGGGGGGGGAGGEWGGRGRGGSTGGAGGAGRAGGTGRGGSSAQNVSESSSPYFLLPPGARHNQL